MLGVEIHVNVEFVKVLEPPEDQENQSTVQSSSYVYKSDIGKWRPHLQLSENVPIRVTLLGSYWA